MSRRLALLALLLLLPRPAAAYFEDVRTGSRGLAIGPSAIAVVTDASSYYWNPAGLAELPKTEVTADWISMYGLSELSSGAVAAATRVRGTSFGVAWHHLGLENVYAEDQLCAAAARRVLTTGSGHRLSAGLTFKFSRAAFEPFAVSGGGIADYGAISRGSFDAGLRLQTPWRTDVAYVVRDVFRPRYEFVEGSGGHQQARRSELAAAFRWNRESTFSVGWSQLGDGRSTLSTGLEINFYDVFAIRTGLSNLATVYRSYGLPENIQYEGGFGVYHHGYHVDAVASTTRELGASYRVTVRVPVSIGGQP
ncbi:MAG: hypothetical protein U0704_14225 [Candidatus Eisenbacteria bacterium]